MRAAATWCAVVAVALVFGTRPAEAAEGLGDVLRDFGWEKIIGIWVGDSPGGGKVTVTYAWRLRGKLAEITTRDGESETVSLVGYNPVTAKVFNLWADDQGGSGRGEWRLEGGQALLTLAFVSGTGQEGTLRIRQRLEGDDTLSVTVDAREPYTLTLTRLPSGQPPPPTKP